MKLHVIFTLCFLAAHCTYAQKPDTSWGRIDRIENFESQYVSPRTIDILLPPNYDPNNKHRVLYMHDGQNLFDAKLSGMQQEWGIDENLKSIGIAGNTDKVIVVGIWNNEKRFQEYLPAIPYYTQSEPALNHFSTFLKKIHPKGEYIPIQSNEYLKFITSELMPYINSKYATGGEDPQFNFIGGSSLGGLISLYAILEYPQLFGGVMCLSTHWLGGTKEHADGFFESLHKYISDKIPPADFKRKFYFDYGTEDVDATYEIFQLKVDKIFEHNNYINHDLFISKKFDGEGHNETAWKKRFEIPYKFLLADYPN